MATSFGDGDGVAVITIEPGRRMIGLQLPIQSQSPTFVAEWETQASPADLRRVAETCDRVGFDYIGVCDHVAIPESHAAAMGTFWMDPISTLGWLAATTTDIALLTHVFVLAYRHPLMAAKQLANIDHLSGGRLIAGVGAGHVEAEFAALGVDHAERGRLLDDDLPALIEALENEFVDGMGARPRPAQQPRPPIWIAGSSKPAIRRAARSGDGWLPQGPATAELVGSLRSELDARDRTDETFAIGHIAAPAYVGEPSWDVGKWTVTGRPHQIAETILRHTPVGVNQIQIRVVGRDLGEYCDQLEAVGASVAPLLRSI